MTKLSLSAWEKRERTIAAFHLFTQRYARKSRRGFDSNDRTYDRDLEKVAKRMPPEQLDAILRDADD